MGKDAFGTERFRCQSKTGCLCLEFCSTIDGMKPEDKAAMEAQEHTLTCQRKSELVIFCVCGHAAWEHASSPDVLPSPAVDVSDDDDSDWAALLRGPGGEPSLLPLGLKLSESSLSVEAARLLLEESGRVAFLSKLKASGVEKLRDRQELANVFGRAKRLAALAEARAANEESGATPEQMLAERMKVVGVGVESKSSLDSVD